jgi:hypothetical protein
VNADTKTVLVYAVIVVGALVSLWLGISIVRAVAPIIASAVIAFTAVISVFIYALLAVVLDVFSIAVPVLLDALGICCFLQILETISREMASLKSMISKQAIEATIDATSIAIFGLLAGLVFYVDVIEDFVTVRFISVGAGLCATCKMMILIPMRATKVVGLLGTAIVVLGLTAILVYRYHLVSPSGISLSAVQAAWESQNEKRSKVFVLIGLGAAGTLLIASVLHPFTGSGWRRIWNWKIG